MEGNMRFLVGVSLLSVLLMTGCGKRGQTDAEAGSRTQTPEPTRIRVAAAETRPLGRSASVTGSLLPDETVSVSAEVAGRLAEIRYDFGQSVRKGDVIAEFDKREFQFQLDRARAALAQALARIGLDPSQENVTPDNTPLIRQARAQLEDARFKYESAARLVKTGDVSQERHIELEKAFRAREAAYEATRDDLRTQIAYIQALRAEVRLAEKRLSDATVRAPFDGAITARLASPGQYMRENTPIVTLVKAHPLRLRLEVPESVAGELRLGMTLTFTTDAAPGAKLHARVTELNPALDPRSRSLTAEARIAERDPRLRPGLFVQVELALAGNASAVVLPREALYRIAGLTKVFLVRDGRVSELKITPGEEIDGWVEVPAGRIRPGDQVAVSKLSMLVDGVPVRIEAQR
jgi:RND family efflux transporter MFP subunit